MDAHASERSEVRSEGLVSTLPLHPFLFAVYPVMRLYEENVYEVEPGDVLVPLAIVLAITSLLFGILWLVLRAPRRAAIITSTVVVLVLTFGQVEEILGPDFGDLRPWLLAAGLAILVALAIVALRTRARLGQLTLGLNVISLTLVILAIVPAAPGLADRLATEADEAVAIAAMEATVEPPERDIYHLVFDRYGSLASLEGQYGIDNSGFMEWLERRGFEVAEDARANYTKTTMSLGAMLGMRLLDDIVAQQGPNSENLFPVVTRIGRNRAGRFLQEQGYEYVHVGSWFNDTRASRIADRSYNPEEEVSFGTTLYDMTILPTLVDRPAFSQSLERRHADSARYQFKLLDALAEEEGGRKYVFAHILLPHGPYVFRERGTYDPVTADYETQLAYTNRRIRRFVESLLDVPEDEQPIIILQADEGPFPDRFQRDQGGFDWSSARDGELLTKFGILTAMYLPGPEGEAPLRDDITAVNTYVEVFRRYFGLEVADQPDRVLASNRKRPYDLVDVTPRLEQLEGE